MSDKRNENTDEKRALVFTEKTSTLVTKGRALLQIEKKGRASLGQGRVRLSV